jgi:hypothetical protein
LANYLMMMYIHCIHYLATNPNGSMILNEGSSDVRITTKNAVSWDAMWLL